GPKDFSCSRIECRKTAVKDRHDHLTFIQRDASADDAAAKTNTATDDLWVIAPYFFSGTGIDSKRDAPVRDPVKNTVCEQRRCFLISTAISNFERPRKAQAVYVRRIDLL